MQPVLSVEKIRKYFGSTKAVDDVSFAVKQGEIFGLLGPNGAGKTTAIRMIMGIIPADSGKIKFTIDGREGAIDKRKIGYLPEERGLYTDAPVLDTLVYLASLKGIPSRKARQDAEEWLERLDLGAYSKQKIEKLSKGMQQKVQFVAAILHRPPLLMLDEPFSGLDPVNQDFFRAIIDELREQGTTILFSAHQMNLVEELCDSIIMIHKGKTVLSGNIAAIKEGYKELIIQITFSGKKGKPITNYSQFAIDSETDRRATLRYAGAANPREIMAIVSEAYDLDEISIRKPPLHDIFVSTVQERGGSVAQR